MCYRVTGKQPNSKMCLVCGLKNPQGTGELLLPGGTVAAEGYGKYIKMPLNKIADFDFEEQERLPRQIRIRLELTCD